jgi:hypothetical protein
MTNVEVQVGETTRCLQRRTGILPVFRRRRQRCRRSQAWRLIFAKDRQDACPTLPANQAHPWRRASPFLRSSGVAQVSKVAVRKDLYRRFLIGRPLQARRRLKVQEPRGRFPSPRPGRSHSRRSLPRGGGPWVYSIFSLDTCVSIAVSCGRDEVLSFRVAARRAAPIIAVQVRPAFRGPALKPFQSKSRSPSALSAFGLKPIQT